MQFSYVFRLFIVLFLLSSCDSDDNVLSSENLSTGRIFATFQVISDGGDDVFAEAQLTLDIPPSSSNHDDTFILLNQGDELWLSAGRSIVDVELDSDDLFGEFQGILAKHTRFEERVSIRETYSFLFELAILNQFGSGYSARLPLSEDGEYRVSLLRDPERSATDSVVILPQDFSLISPIANDTYSRGSDDILVEWQGIAPDASVQIDVKLSCGQDDFASYRATTETDMGSFTIPANALASGEITGICSATLEVRKVHVGQFDPSFTGGAVNAYQIRRRVFLLED